MLQDIFRTAFKIAVADVPAPPPENATMTMSEAVYPDPALRSVIVFSEPDDATVAVKRAPLPCPPTAPMFGIPA